MADSDKALADALLTARERMSPQQQVEFDARMTAALEATMARYAAMERTVGAVGVLHRAGTGERAGFCVECGNVVPCQTVRFLEPFLP